MRLLLDTSAVSFQVTRAAEARKDFGKDVQKVDRDTGRPQWVVEVLAQDADRGEVIRVTVTGDQPKVNPGSQVRFDALEAIAWNNNGKGGVAYRAAAIHPALETRLRVISADPLARLFTGPRGGRITTAVLRDATHWDEVVTQLGYPYLRRHDLRHTGLTWMADAGVPVHVLRKIAGHGSLTTTQRYLHPDSQSITEAGDALSAHLTARRFDSRYLNAV